LALSACVADGACVEVVAALLIGYELAPEARLARIIGAGIVVRADLRNAGLATAFQTLISNGAGVAVVAGEALMVRHQRAVARIRGAGGHEADCIRPFVRGGTGHFAVRRNGALVWQGLQVAKEGSVAQVAIFQLQAVCILLAVTWNSHPHALSFHALVGDGTGVSIVAVKGVVLELASAKPIAGVIGTHIAVVAGNGRAQTYPLLAMVSHGACIAIHALALGEFFVGTALFAFAGVLGAAVFVIAEVHGLAFHKVALINIAVTVVIDGIARFLCRHRSVTG